MTTHQIKCAACNIPLQGPADPKPKDMFTCPSCGSGDHLENIVAEIKEYVATQVKEGLSAKLPEVARDSPFMQVAIHQIPEKSYRFFVDFDGKA